MTTTDVLRLALATALAVAAPLSAQTRRPVRAAEPEIPDIAFTKYTLKNGLTLLVHEDHKAPIVAVNVWYHVGSKNERPGRTGFAHLFEHLMFNGSEHYNDDYLAAVEKAGATDLNGTTNEDRTNYFQNVPVPALDRILWLESDRMGHLLGAIDQPRLDEQRGVVQNEKRQGESQPYGKTWISITENTYPKGHPYSWSVIGSMEDLNGAALDDVKDWFRTYYGAANATLVVAGDVSAEDVRQRVERYFGDVPPGPPITKQGEWIAKNTGTHRQIMQDRVPQARVYKIWNAPPYGAADETYLELTVRLLAQGKTSRLYKRLVYDERIATDVVGFVDDREIGSQVYLWATVQPGGDLAKVERALDEELARFIRQGPTPAELERVKTQYRAEFVRGLERIGGFGGKSDFLARHQVILGDPAAYKTIVRRVMKATPAAVQSAASRWLSDGQYVLEVHPYEDLETIATDVDRSKLPEPGAAPNAPLPAPERATLSNGLKVQLVRRTTVPVVNLSLLADAGYAADHGGAPGTASLTLNMMDEGTRTRSALVISDQLESIGARLFTGSDLDVSYVTLSALKDRLDPALDIYADVVLNPVFPASDLDRVRKNTLARIQQEKVQPVSMGLRVLPQLLYGENHAYGQPLTGSGTEQSVAAMTRADLDRFHKTWFKPNHATLVVVGDITLAELTPKLERVFAAWKPGDVPAKNLQAVAPRARREVFIMDRPGAEQSVIFSGQLLPPRNNPNEYAFQVFNDAFGGSFGGRMNQNLREDKHWSYGAYAFSLDARGQRPWMVYAPVQTDKTKESLQEVMKELNDATGPRPISGKELDEAKDRLTRSLAGRWETGDAVAGALQEIDTFGLPADYYSTYADRIRGISADEVARVSKAVIQPDREVILVVGDRAKIEAGIRELNLGPLLLLDADGKPKETAASP